jgi:hypothetical protein
MLTEYKANVPEGLGTPGERRGAESITSGVNLVAVSVILFLCFAVSDRQIELEKLGQVSNRTLVERVAIYREMLKDGGGETDGVLGSCGEVSEGHRATGVAPP